MAELERRAAGSPAATAPAAAPAQNAQGLDIEGLPAMLGRLGDNVMTLVDAKLGLAKVELKEEAAAYGSKIAMIAVGGVLAAIGFALLNVAIAFFMARLFFYSFTPPISYALGFVVTGVLYLVIGAILVVVMKNRLAALNPAPERTIEEFRKDKQWLKKEL
ncbi:MAG TPA: phage holin family protein [Pyrinomonadaceae bacterium]|nr:phage holin family protein [Pyrinomonadaceae bacterium]